MNPHYEFISDYFLQVRIGHYFELGIGLISITLALFFLIVIKYSFFKGVAYPILMIGIFQVIASASNILNTNLEKEPFQLIVKQDIENIKTNEVPKMENKLKSFTRHMIIYGIIMFTGMILFFYFRSSQTQFWRGFGLGLVCQSVLMLILTYSAQDGVRVYIDQLRILTS